MRKCRHSQTSLESQSINSTTEKITSFHRFRFNRNNHNAVSAQYWEGPHKSSNTHIKETTILINMITLMNFKILINSTKDLIPNSEFSRYPIHNSECKDPFPKSKFNNRYLNHLNHKQSHNQKSGPNHKISSPDLNSAFNPKESNWAKIKRHKMEKLDLHYLPTNLVIFKETNTQWLMKQKFCLILAQVQRKGTTDHSKWWLSEDCIFYNFISFL